MEGWIKLHRKLLDNPIFENEKALKIWIWFLLKATHTEREQLVGLQVIKLKKGQFIIGRKKASKELNINESTIYKYIKVFEKLKMITTKSNNKLTVVSIEKWEDYQSTDEEKEQQNNNKITTEEQQSNTNKNVKNVKNVKNIVVVEEQSDSCVDEIVDFYNNNIGTVTPFAYEILQDYEKELGKELVVYAMQKAVESNARNIRYIKAILNSWSNKGIKSLQEAKDESANRQTKQETEEEVNARRKKQLEEALKNDNT